MQEIIFIVKLKSKIIINFNMFVLLTPVYSFPGSMISTNIYQLIFIIYYIVQGTLIHGNQH